MNDIVRVKGKCDSRFMAVKEVFQENFEKRGEVGAAVCVYIDGKPVVDLWGGYADATRKKPWNHDTIVSVASTTKGMVAICAHILAERGLLDLDAPVARYWPEFKQAGKDHIPVHWLLSHRAGLPSVHQDMPPESLFDWQLYTSVLAETEPWWEPGTKHGYHALTYGYLVGEVIRRVSGKSVGQFFRSEVGGPLNVDFFIGIPATEDHRVAEILPDLPPNPDETSMWDVIRKDPSSMTGRAFLNPPRTPEVMNTRAWRAAEIPSSNGHTTAEALGKIYGTLAIGGKLSSIRILNPGTINAAIVEQSFGTDSVLMILTRFGLGFMLTNSLQTFGPNEKAFGHPGMGGSLGFADIDAGLGFGYVMNQYQTGTLESPDMRWPELVKAVYASFS